MLQEHSASSASSDQTNIVRSNSKKRSRASRRAPTTVLTTDTTNFRAMVQEFTGIPAPPFTSSPFPRSRLDLFGTPSSMRSSHHFDSSTPPYLLRPFAQKLQPQPPPPFVSSSSSSSFPSSSMVDAAATASTTNITSGSSNHTSNSTSINYQLPSDFALLKQHPQNPLNLHNNPILTFQSLLQTPPRYNPLANSAILGSKPQGSLEIPSGDPHLKMGGLEEFGLSHGHVSTHLGGGLQNIVSSDGTASSRRDNHHPPSWGGDGAGSNNDGDQGLLRSLNGNYSHSQRVTNGKLHFSSASSSDFHGDKGSENVSTRSEGMVESWICSD
ncbi:hypothetical protein L1049_003001 [Liquidambar formosana]|uniref:VQ domain-containing protein n=1 Tax=Liquidambar formosana TaxID=63359 RepID=A0AAP0R7U7_LIQFO